MKYIVYGFMLLATLYLFVHLTVANVTLRKFWDMDTRIGDVEARISVLETCKCERFHDIEACECR